MKNLLLIAVLLAPAAAAQITTGTVSGEIRNRQGQPAAGVRVSAMAVPTTGAPANSGTALVSISTTDSQGRYKLENVTRQDSWIRRRTTPECLRCRALRW
jgi:hypothetical protein